MAQSTFRSLYQALFRRAHFKQKGFRIKYNVLCRQTDINNIVVFGQHQTLYADRTNLGCIDFENGINQRRIPAQTWLYGGVVLTETQHNTALLLIDLINA